MKRRANCERRDKGRARETDRTDLALVAQYKLTDNPFDNEPDDPVRKPYH